MENSAVAEADSNRRQAIATVRLHERSYARHRARVARLLQPRAHGTPREFRPRDRQPALLRLHGTVGSSLSVARAWLARLFYRALDRPSEARRARGLRQFARNAEKSDHLAREHIAISVDLVTIRLPEESFRADARHGRCGCGGHSVEGRAAGANLPVGTSSICNAGGPFESAELDTPTIQINRC